MLGNKDPKSLISETAEYHKQPQVEIRFKRDTSVTLWRHCTTTSAFKMNQKEESHDVDYFIEKPLADTSTIIIKIFSTSTKIVFLVLTLRLNRKQWFLKAASDDEAVKNDLSLKFFFINRRSKSRGKVVAKILWHFLSLSIRYDAF